MDDLSGLDWSAAPKSNNAAPLKPAPSMSNYSGFRATPPPLSSNNTPQPFSRPSSALSAQKLPTKSPSPANDSFSSLLSLNSKKAPSNLTLQDRQRQLLEDKRKQEAEQRKRLDSQFSANDAHLWDNLGSGRGTPEARTASPAAPLGDRQLGGAKDEHEDDILAAFNSVAPVDKSSHFPPRFQLNNANNGMLGDDDDPFGLGAMPARSAGRSPQPAPQTDDDDDILGDLGKPVTAKPPQRAPVDETFNIEEPETTPSPPPASDPRDRAIAELVDMGFPTDRSRRALDETDGNIQAAVSWLLNQAHEESRQRSRGGQGEERHRTPIQEVRSQRQTAAQRGPRDQSEDSLPAWMRQEGRSGSAQRKQDGRSPGPEKDAARLASEFGTSLFKSANSLWKTGQKQMQRAIADFQQEGNPNQPKWMREASADSQRASSRGPQEAAPRAQARSAAEATDEAMMLESGAGRPQKPSRPSATEPHRLAPNGSLSRGRSPAHDLPDRTTPQPRLMQQQSSPAIDKRPTTKLSRQEVEEQTSQAYVSPARRKRPTPKPEAEPEVDLFSDAPARTPVPAVRPASIPQRPRPTVAPRNIPQVSPTALSNSAQHRNAGTAAFKRGDYAAAHASYTSALSPIPPAHPLTIIILSNRALTAIKTGDPKVAVADADAALNLIGSARGEGETIDTGDGVKEMKEFYGKALMRKAEALENMERWSEAGGAWRLCIEAGVGGAVSLRGRDRCEKAAAGGSGDASAATTARAAPARPAQPTKKPPPKPIARPQLSSQASAEAVKKLRAANAAAEKADDEKFLLSDQVEARINSWKGGKADNLRALLGSLDAVLWPEAGWKKVGMSDLVIPGKVKIIYMKAIAKVHPDKVVQQIPQSATTEQRMISASVFATLNEAWDKFKRDNGL
ncbi:auxilin-like clathrin-binding protein required for normal clathrin function [Taxawa tesnikishii (nom. ined.)]|nr:auxilin-like clathrin-binding protein required for normal clathrin function [Dothideales sp. JES 119]